MAKVTRKLSRQMEKLMDIGPIPQRLLVSPDVSAVRDDASTDSSLLSEAFSEYAPLEEAPAAGLHGQLAKFSSHFQAVMHEVQASRQQEAVADVSLPRKQMEKLNWDTVLGAVNLGVEVPEGLVLSEDEDTAEMPATRDEGGVWPMLEQYSQFTLSVPRGDGAALGHTHHWLDQTPAHGDTRESALRKCAAWLEQHAPSLPAPATSDPADLPQEKVEELSSRVQSGKKQHETEKSKWGKAALASTFKLK